MPYVHMSFNTPRAFGAFVIFLVFSVFLTSSDAALATEPGATAWLPERPESIANMRHVGMTQRLLGTRSDWEGEAGEDSIAGLFDPVLRLNRFSFQSTILDEYDTTGALYSDAVPHWIVLFCPPWYEPCQALEPVFQRLAKQWEAQLNKALLNAEVRFAAVDCATEKALCNTQNVTQYPFVAHYRRHQQVSRWKGERYDTDEKRLKSWLEAELLKKEALLKLLQEQLQKLESLSGFNFFHWGDSFTPFHIEAPSASTSRLIIAGLVFAAIAANALLLSYGGVRSEMSPATSSTKPSMEAFNNQEGIISVSGPPEGLRSSCVMRSLPKEWGRDRPSLVL